MANVTPREHFKVKDYERGSNICGNNRWNSVRFSPHLIFASHSGCITNMRYLVMGIKDYLKLDYDEATDGNFR